MKDNVASKREYSKGNQELREEMSDERCLITWPVVAYLTLEQRRQSREGSGLRST